eukprot:COSAG06_NODE_129_length_22602_cov_7.116318_15_plen_157_part_00
MVATVGFYKTYGDGLEFTTAVRRETLDCPSSYYAGLYFESVKVDPINELNRPNTRDPAAAAGKVCSLPVGVLAGTAIQGVLWTYLPRYLPPEPPAAVTAAAHSGGAEGRRGPARRLLWMCGVAFAVWLCCAAVAVGVMDVVTARGGEVHYLTLHTH